MTRAQKKFATMIRNLFMELPGEKLSEENVRSGMAIARVSHDWTCRNRIALFMPPFPARCCVPYNLPLFVLNIRNDVVSSEIIKQVDTRTGEKRILDMLIQMVDEALEYVDRSMGNKTWEPRDWWIEVRKKLGKRLKELGGQA